MHRRTRAPVVAAVVAVTALHAQELPGFADLSLPAGVGTVDSLGKLVAVADSTAVHVWSAFTRRWHALPAAPGAPRFQTNDIVLVRDVGTWTAFASTRGRFAPLAVSPSASLVNPPSHNNDAVLLVRDGGSLHAFSGFVGRWVTRGISPTALVDSQRNVALLADNGLLSAFDAYSGQWYDHPGTEPILQLSCDGTCGLAIGSTTVHGFSALRASWATAPLPPSATLLRDDDWAVLHDGVQGLGFSGLTGTFATAVTGPIQATRSEDLLGMFTVAGAVHAYSAIRGAWAQTAISPLASVRTNVACGVVVDGPSTIAYSAPLAQFVPLAVDSGNEALAGVVVAITDQGSQQPYLFSALTGTWQAAPADALPLLPRVTTTVALLATSYGWRAFSARDGSFTPLLAPGSTAESNENSAPAVVWDATAIWFFDARSNRWKGTARSATPAPAPSVQIWRTNAVVMDGGELIGFGNQGGSIHRASYVGPIVGFRANSESSAVWTPTHVFAGTGLAVPTSLVQFPDFRRVLTVGATYRLHVAMTTGDVALLGYGPLAAAPIALPGLGELQLDPAAMVVTAMVPEVDAERGVFEVQVPPSAALQGVRVALQALVQPASRSAFLSDAIEVWVG